MDLRQIEMFCAVVDCGSVTAAARSLGVSQSAVSHALGKLERRVGFKLFDRDGRQVTLTAEARLLYPEGRDLLDKVGQFDASVRKVFNGERGTLTVASHPNPATSWLPLVAAAFRREWPEVRLRLVTKSSEEVRELALTSAFDLGIATAPFAGGELVLQRYSLPRVAVMARNHPLAQHAVLTPQLLAGEDMIAVVPASWNWALVTRAFDKAGAVCHVVAECELITTGLSLAMAGVGVCLADLISAATCGAGAVQRPFQPTTPYEIGLLCPAHGRLSAPARAFVEAVNRHITSHFREL